MVLRSLALLARVRVTVAYAVIVTCVTTALVRLDPQVQDRVMARGKCLRSAVTASPMIAGWLISPSTYPKKR
jgi:hypothetical protein